MRNAKHLNASRYVDMAGVLHASVTRERMLETHPLTDSETATLYALDVISDILSDGSFAHPETLTQEGVQNYALALLRVRECAGMAEMDRLANACDALAVTVSRLLEDQGNASHAKCEALTQFVAHAQAMVQMSSNKREACVLSPFPASTLRADTAARSMAFMPTRFKQ